MWSCSKFLPVFLICWDFCYHPGLSAVESSVLSREYSREMTIPHVLHVPSQEQRKDETLKFCKDMLLAEVCKRRVIFAVSHLYWSSGWKMRKLKTSSAPTQNMQSPLVFDTAVLHLPLFLVNLALSVWVQRCQPVPSVLCWRPWFHSAYFWLSLWLLLPAFHHSTFYLMNFNYYSFFAEHLETFFLKYILVLISEFAVWTNFPILYSYFSYLFFSQCACLLS